MTASDPFHLTPKQLEALEVMAGEATHILGEGGSRSGKTFLIVRAIVMRAMKAANSRHLIARFRFNHVKAAIINDTFPKVMRLAFPDVKFHMDRSDWYARLPNGSEIWFGGLDEKERTEKILGQEYATIFLNEVSQIPWESRELALTRLAQLALREDGRPLPLRAYYDCNPSNKAHWAYKLFHLKVDPEKTGGSPLRNPHEYTRFHLHPRDNTRNVSPQYLKILAGLSARKRLRFLDGSWAEATPNQLFPEEIIEKWRQMEDVPQIIRLVVGVDPSGSGDEDNADNDEIGLVVGGLGVDGNAYLLEDCSIKAGPGTWGKIAVAAYERHEADVIVGEVNFGGAMVKHVIQTARAKTPFKPVTASRGKTVRAEPFSALYEQGKVRHVGEFPQLEEELAAMTTHGYTASGSPNRADAWIWVLAELFPGLIKEKVEPVKKRERVRTSRVGGWMR